MGLAWSDHREQTVLMAIAVLDDAGRDVTSDSIDEFITQRTIDLGPLPADASLFGSDATKFQVLRSLEALQGEDPPYINGRPTSSLGAARSRSIDPTTLHALDPREWSRPYGLVQVKPRLSKQEGR